MLHAEWDADLPSYLAQGYFAQLKNTPYKRLIELSEGTHTVMMEKNRMQFFRELMGFLDEEKPLALKYRAKPDILDVGCRPDAPAFCF